jgi:hypothetical protein
MIAKCIDNKMEYQLSRLFYNTLATAITIKLSLKSLNIIIRLLLHRMSKLDSNTGDRLNLIGQKVTGTSGIVIGYGQDCLKISIK